MWTLSYDDTGVEKSLTDWGFAYPVLEYESQGRTVFKETNPGARAVVNPPLIPFNGLVSLYRNRTTPAPNAPPGTGWSGGQRVFQGRQVTRRGAASPREPLDLLTFADAWYDLENLVFQQFWNFGNPPVKTYFSRLNLFQSYSQPTKIVGMANGVGIVTITLAQGMQLQNGNSVTVYAVPSVGLDNQAFPVTIVGLDAFGNALQVTIPAQISPATYTGGAVLYANSQLQTNGQQILEIISFAQAAGVKIQPGAIGLVDMNWELPIYPVRGVMCASAIQICLKATPDAVHWIDYTTNPPTFNCHQRPSLPTITMPFADGLKHVSSEIVPRFDLQPVKVVLQYQRTDTVNGQPVSSSVTDSADASGSPAASVAPAVRAMVVPIDLRGAVASELSVAITSVAIPSSAVQNQTVPNNSWWTQKHHALGDTDITNLAFVPGTLKVVDDAGNDYSATWQNLFPNEHQDGEIATWMKKQCLTVTVSGQFTYGQQDAKSRPVAAIGANKPHTVHVRVKLTNSGPGRVTYQTLASYASGETAPVGLAQNIFTALSVLQWEGSHTVVDDGFDTTSTIPGPQNVLNLAGGNVAWASMNAVVQRVSLDIFRHTCELTFGPVKHLAPGDLEELLQFWRYRTVFDNPALRIGGSGTDGKPQLGGQPAKENTEHANPAEQLKTLQAPSTHSDTFVQFDAAKQLIVIKVVDDAGNIVSTAPYVRIGLGDAFSSDAPPAPKNLFIQEWTVCLADGTQKRALFLSSGPY